MSDSLTFVGDEVGRLNSGKIVRKIAMFRGKKFEWVAELGDLVASPESVKSSEPIDIDELSEGELAHNLRGLAFFAGHQFLEAEPAWELARRVRQHRQLQREGASFEQLQAILPDQATWVGKAPTDMDFARVERPMSVLRVHGTDDRRVMNNMSYPHRTHIVFDNTGSTTVIDGSEGSGTLIADSTAMSVAHVFWDEDRNTWEATHKWAPGFDSEDSDPSPWGQWHGCYWVTIPQAYPVYENSTYDYAVINFDVGCDQVRDGVNSDAPGATLGHMGSYAASDSAIEARTGYVRGYPGNGTCGSASAACNVRVWGDYSRASENDISGSHILHQADTSGGQSGSAFYHYTDPTCTGCDYGAYLVGMHRAGDSSYNYARRYNSTVHAFMLRHKDDYLW